LTPHHLHSHHAFSECTPFDCQNLPEDLSAALDREKRRRGVSLNQTVIDLSRLSLGVTGTRSNGLARLAGSWTAAEERQFLRRIRKFEEIDRDLYK